ncbi:MAG: ABC transporter ATP-binding protein/permease [Verrucomicrobiales bacterium]|nr:ABC transporter ATP-binding protein/permease [Verrucomicrobiales bacterium]
MNYWAARVPLAQFLYGLGLPLALWVGGRQVIQGDLAVGDLASVVFYLMAIGHRVNLVGHFTDIVQNASASAERVLEIIGEPQTLKSGSRKLPFTGRGEVRFENVGFNYRDGKASLTGVTFVAQPGQTLAIVGPTGSGKTTLVNLIPRFYDVNAGRVVIDGLDVRELQITWLRRSVSVIFQETFLFSTTVAENIAYGRPDASRQEIETAARLAQAHDFIEELEDSYGTVIGERGVSLSGGQKQRIAIARAFVMNPRILILDDATASVDSRTERLIQEAMRQLAAGRTTFVIAHRFSTVKHADSILVLKEGRIAEQGTHDELIRCAGFYREILQQQISR